MIDPLLEIMRILRDPATGCDWDKRQTFATIAPYTIEEAYEVLDAIDRDDLDSLKDELGDLLLQVVFHAQIADDRDLFTFADVVTAICDKMTRRHPHIFGNSAISPGWEELKAAERADAKTSSVLGGVAAALPALMRAQKIQKRAARVGFDWPDKVPVKAKLLEELEEVEQAITQEEIYEEIGDLLFSAVNLARHHGVDAERALSSATKKFEQRFEVMEAMSYNNMKDMAIDELEQLWQSAKRQLAEN